MSLIVNTINSTKIRLNPQINICKINFKPYGFKMLLFLTLFKNRFMKQQQFINVNLDNKWTNLKYLL